MKSIVAVNCNIPTAEAHLTYFSGSSLRDFDIAIFSPAFPFCERVYFDGGGSVVAIEATRKVATARSHWSREISECLRAGKTVFVVLDEGKTDDFATGSKLANRQRTYSSVKISNYSAIPGELKYYNTRGVKILATDSRYKNLLHIISEFAEYRLIVTSDVAKPVFTAKDGSVVGAEHRVSEWPGTMIFLPFFEFDGENFVEQNDQDESVWTERALKTSSALLSQMVEIDKSLRSSDKSTPRPDWMKQIPIPTALDVLNSDIQTIDESISDLQEKRAAIVSALSELEEYAGLLFENGKPLERAVEKSLKLLGYHSEGLETNSLEIDHVITGPSGIRMIGESEGKDTSPIDISKFRQLESNIGEDFQRDEVLEPAKGILFGNGFRLTPPSDRPRQFTDKSVTNAKRLGSSLVQTSDLYAIVAYLLDNPKDDSFRTACCSAIEQEAGGIVQFPTVPV